MRADALLLVVAVLATGCASAPNAPERDGPLRYTPRVAATPAWVEPPGDSGPEGHPRRLRRKWLRHDVTEAGPGAVSGAVGGRERSAAAARQAVHDAIDEVKRSMEGSEAARAQLASRLPALGGRGLHGVFTRYLDHGSRQRAWLRGTLGSATALVRVASQVEDSDMERGLLRMSGPRLQAAMFGALLLATWVDFLQLADAVLRQCPAYSVEKLYADLLRVQGLMTPTLADLASGDSERVEAAATAMPALMGELTREFDTIHRGARAAMENGAKLMVAAQVVEMFTMVSTLKLSLPRLPPAGPATLGVGLVMSPGGVMVGSRIVVSAEWVEMMRRLVQAGVISLPAVSAAIRIHGVQVMMAQAHQDLPKGVRDALGDSPEVRGMQVTGRAGAGMSDAPKHHVLPKEHRAWFEARGFKGDMDIDQFCVRLERAHHEAIHGGGDWRLGRTWPGEWNQFLMRELLKAEERAGRMLTRNAILKLVAKHMKDYKLPMNFTSWRGQ
ncbi:TIGR02269 family lipoprotein [Myxococcus sp. SDU36]|nr:DUF2380 domain-containing protein [Myxococcus sp. SDU36]WIG94104.1 TIGR02269 family lipoprotein [Myxococcus sp. SDU36]